MTNQLNIFLLSLGILQGALLSGYFLRKQAWHPANVYFVLILFIAGLQMTFKVLSKMWLTQHVGLPYFMSYNLPFLIGPLMYLYVRARMGVPSRKSQVLHFLPFLWTVVEVIVQSDAGYWDSPLRSLAMSAQVRLAVQLVSLASYAWFSWRLLDKRKHLSLQRFILGLTVVEMVIIITLAVMYINYPRYTDARLLFVSLTLLIYWISYKQLEQPDLFVSPDLTSASLKVASHVKYRHSGLKEGEGEVIARQLQQLMTEQRLYLDVDLTMETLSARLNISRHTLSQVLNERFQKPYFEFVNEFRLREAQARLHDPKYRHYTIAAIALDAGFNSVSNFNELFRKRLGKTPSAFRDQALKQMSA
ncbi:MAG: AraC family transcriptional regulator [Cyclobacteriaceae bacterium]|nr:AraC family transcriptional regulator [Cyclobacteriaceae bacterium]